MSCSSLAHTKPLYQSYRAGVRRLSHWLFTRREESPSQRKVGVSAAQNQFGSAAIACKYNTSVKSRVKWMVTIWCSHFPLYRDFPLYKGHQFGKAAAAVVPEAVSPHTKARRITSAGLSLWRKMCLWEELKHLCFDCLWNFLYIYTYYTLGNSFRMLTAHRPIEWHKHKGLYKGM